jgi:hypothetical protein
MGKDCLLAKRNGERMFKKEGEPAQPRYRRLTRRSFMAGLSAASVGMLSADQMGCSVGDENPTLENHALRLVFDRKTGLLATMHNKLTDENLEIRDDDFRVDAEEFILTTHDTRLETLRRTSPEVFEASYRAEGRTLTAVYKLGRKNHFFEKQLFLTSSTPFGLKNLVLGRYSLGRANLTVVKYMWLKNSVYFGRSDSGGFFLGVELPFDSSSLDSNGIVSLGYAPSLKVAANERLVSEPIYWSLQERA